MEIKKKPTVKYFRVFQSKCYILRDGENTHKLENKSDEKIFLEYSSNNRAYRVYNLRTKIVIESINVVVDDDVSTKTISKELKELESSNLPKYDDD